MKKLNLFIYPALIIMILITSCKTQPVKLIAGTFTEDGPKGLNIFDLNGEEGTFNLLSESDAGPNPSYFCFSKKNGLIYAANEVMEFKGVKGGGLTVLRYDAGRGFVENVKELVVPYGGPCYISLSPSEDFLFIANYSSSSVAVVKLDNKGIPERVTDTITYKGDGGVVSHPHMISFDPSGERVYLTDLGLDQVVIYDFDVVSGRLKQIKNGIVSFPKGSGPRHFVFSANGERMYVICELNSTVSVFDVNSNGELNLVQTLTTLGEGFKGESYCADIHIGKDARYLYGSNRGENTIVTFSIGSDGMLTPAGRTYCGGDWPRNFIIDPSGDFLLVGNQRSGNISLFRIDNRSGLAIEPAKNYNIKAPACLKFY